MVLLFVLLCFFVMAFNLGYGRRFTFPWLVLLRRNVIPMAVTVALYAYLHFSIPLRWCRAFRATPQNGSSLNGGR